MEQNTKTERNDANLGTDLWRGGHDPGALAVRVNFPEAHDCVDRPSFFSLQRVSEVHERDQ
jgi:hypothetical protein